MSKIIQSYIMLISFDRLLWCADNFVHQETGHVIMKLESIKCFSFGPLDARSDL